MGWNFSNPKTQYIVALGVNVMAGKKGRPANTFARKGGVLYTMGSLQYKAFLGEIADGNHPNVNNFGKKVEINDPVNLDEIGQREAQSILARMAKESEDEGSEE